MRRSAAMGTRATIREAGGRIYVRWWSDDADTWRALLDAFKRAFPLPGQRSFHPATKEWSLPLSERGALGTWLMTNFGPDAVQWLDDDDDDARQDAPRQAQARPVDQAYADLYLVPAAPLWAAEAVYRAAQKVHHPDRGGDHDRAVAVNSAIATIRARAS